MDLSIRDWMLVIGVLLILAVLLDGYRRVRKAHAAKIRMSLKSVPPAGSEDLTRGELPNGGARIAPRGSIGNPAEHAGPKAHQEPTFGDELLSASAAYARQRFEEPELTAEADHQDFAGIDKIVPVQSSSADDTVTISGKATKHEAQRQSVVDDSARRSVVPEHSYEPESNEEEYDDVRIDDDASKPAAAGLREIIVVNAVSKDPLGFNGEELLHILLTCDLRFGKMNIFHRYEKSNAKGPVQFSVANAVEPGTFDLNNMRKFRTPGICLFLQLPGPQDAQKALEYMVETAQCIARNLNGELRDEDRSALTVQTVEHYRSRIREFDRKRMAKHA